MKIRTFIQIVCLITIYTLSGCRKNNHQTTVAIQALGNFSTSLIDTIYNNLSDIYGFRVVILPQRPLPEDAFINVKSPRYRADKLIRYLKNIKPDSVDYIMGLTAKDISTTKKDKHGNVKKPESKYKDFGIFGLGFRPGRSCIISIYRLQNTSRKNFINRLKKITVHELGHNLGLPHCPTEKCVMNDANETIKTIDLARLKLCDKCKQKIHYHPEPY